MTIKKYFQSTNKINNSRRNLFFLSLILLFAFILRFIGLNWDQGQHLHPDERFLTIVLTDIKIPKNFKEYLNPQISPLNPYNHNYNFFVYGPFPLNIVKISSEILGKTDYHEVHLVGRLFTIILDTLVVLFVFLISKNIFNKKIALFSAFFYSISVLPIQLSHFYTVDPFLNFFIVVCFYLLVLLKNKTKVFLKIVILSLFFAMAIASKISALYFLPVIFITFIFLSSKNRKKLIGYSFLFIFLTIIFFRLNQPQLFSTGNFFNWSFNQQFLNNLKELQSYNKNYFYPPGIQWLKTLPLIFPLKNIILWGTGIPLGFLFIFSIFYTIFHLFNKSFFKKFFVFLILFWILFLFIYQGCQHVTTMRYFLPIYPFFCILSAFSISQFKIFKNYLFKLLLILILLIYPFSFISIYFKDHSRVSASKWIYQNIPVGSNLLTEYWDDSLPLSIGNSHPGLYKTKNISVADPDSQEKSKTIKNELNNSDYIILSSNRFYIPIPNNSDIYPLTTKYYESLFDGSLGFVKIAEFSSYPCLPPFGKAWFCINDTNAEEAFTVYDHPKVLIFKKTSSFNLDAF